MTKPGEGHFTHNTRSVGVSHLLKEGHTVCITPSKSYLYRSTQHLEQQICVELQKQPSLLESILENPRGFFHLITGCVRELNHSQRGKPQPPHSSLHCPDYLDKLQIHVQSLHSKSWFGYTDSMAPCEQHHQVEGSEG